MPARISHNVQLKQSHRHLSLHHAEVARNIEHLASGQRLNRSSDDPASLALADSLNSEVRAVAEGGRNIQQSISLLQVADGALDEVSAVVRRLRELAVQAGSSVFVDRDRILIDDEFQQLKNEIDRIAQSTTYNRVSLLDSGRELKIQLGPSPDGGDSTSIRLGDMRASGPSLDLGAISVRTIEDARQAISRLRAAQEKIIGERNRIGAFQNRLELSADTSASVIERLRKAEDEVRGLDISRSVIQMTRAQILVQTAGSFAVEADANIDQILSLLR